MDFADVPPRLPGPALGFRNVTVNKPHLAEPHQNGDYLTTTIPLQPRANHVPVLSNRGAGIQWNLQAAQAPKPRPTREPLTMFRGNFCVDYPVPSRLLRQVPHSKSTRDEFNHMRYSAVTCDPVDFYAEQFTLRPTLFGTPRSTEIMIILTMYNEDEVLFARTLKGILTNIKDLASRDSEVWGKSSWKNIVVCIISDGRSKIHPRTRALLTLLGVYQEGRAKQRIHDKDITAHLYEYTTQMQIEINRRTVKVTPGTLPCQILFCLKEKNQKRMNSHRWALQAFGRILEPKMCVLIDAGTEPGPNSIYHLWKTFDQNPSCGSVSGHTKVLMSPQQIITNPLVAAQNFEYELWNLLDRPFDSIFGFRFDMPGAMVAHRFVALQNNASGDGPMDTYFAAERARFNQSIFESNMYLTEDQTLSFALVTKKNCFWDLRYNSAASATIDVPETGAEYISQRRRWLNGNFFGSVYAITHIFHIFRSSHTTMRKSLLVVQCIYQGTNMIYSWFSLGTTFLVFHFIMANSINYAVSGLFGQNILQLFDFLYLGLLFLSFVFALGHRPMADRLFLSILIKAWSALMMIFSFGYLVISVASARGGQLSLLPSSNIISTIIPLLFMYSSWVVLACLSGSARHIFTSLIQYLILVPFRVNTLSLYAFCNIHDVSWGTRGFDTLPPLGAVRSGKYNISMPMDEADPSFLETMFEDAVQLLKAKAAEQPYVPSSMDEIESEYKSFRTIIVSSWALSNGLLVFVVLSIIGSYDEKSYIEQGTRFVVSVFWSLAYMNGIKFLGAIYYFISILSGRSQASQRSKQSLRISKKGDRTGGHKKKSN